MDSHENARTTPRGRLLMVERLRGGWSLGQVAAAAGVSARTVRKWRDRFAAEGEAGLRDRSARPLQCPTRLPPQTTAQIEVLRRQRRSGPAIARQLGLPVSTVGLELRRLGLGRLRALDAKPEIIRYERERPGELIHIDIKKLGRFERTGHRITGDRTGQSNSRGIGWEYLHLAIDDHSRLAYSEILPDEKRGSCLRFLFNALRFFRRHGVAVERVMTDNGPAFISRRYAKALRLLNIQHKRTRPYTPKTNGKAERFVQTSLREWAYAKAYETSDQRRSELGAFLFRYNWYRPHMSLKAKPPISRLRLPEDNLLMLHI
jgi:transposase InsO family protein